MSKGKSHSRKSRTNILRANQRMAVTKARRLAREQARAARYNRHDYDGNDQGEPIPA